MQYDLYLVIGLVIVGFAIPSMVSAYAESRAPRAAAIVLLIGGGLVTYAVTQSPEGYRLEDIPHAFVRVIAQIMDIAR
jgi:hypothetical protein